MPQLNPAPWFMIMLMSWGILLMLFSPKISHTSQQNPPLTCAQTPHKATPWDWPWA